VRVDLVGKTIIKRQSNIRRLAGSQVVVYRASLDAESPVRVVARTIEQAAELLNIAMDAVSSVHEPGNERARGEAAERH